MHLGLSKGADVWPFAKRGKLGLWGWDKSYISIKIQYLLNTFSFIKVEICFGSHDL